MQLMTFNSLLMFDIVFIFFLFLIGVTCLLYYLPPKVKKPFRSRYKREYEVDEFIVEEIEEDEEVEESSFIVKNGVGEQQSFAKCCKYCEKCKIIYQEVYSDRNLLLPKSQSSVKINVTYPTTSSSAALHTSNSSCYLKAKECDTRNCKGPVYEV